VALGNSHNPAAVPALSEALGHDPSTLVRAHAAWALGEIGVREARRALEQARVREPDAAVRAEVEEAVGRR
jgi:epoxyqueuosine reductase